MNGGEGRMSSSSAAKEIEANKVATKTPTKQCHRQGTMAFFRGLGRAEWLTLGVLGLAQFCSQVTFSCIVPFFPSEAAQKGLSTAQIGLLIGVFQLASFLASPLLGKFMAQLGPKRLFTSGLLIGGFGVILFGLVRSLPSGPPFFWAALLVRIVKALGSACYATSSLTIVAQSFPNKVASVMSLMEICCGLGYTAGPLVGSGLYELGGYPLPFFVLGSAMLVSALVSLPSMLTRRPTKGEDGKMEAEDKAKAKEKEGKEGGWRLLAIPQIWLAIWAALTLDASCFFYDASLADHLADLNGGPMLVGLMISLVSATYLLSAPICGWFVDRWPGRSPWLMLAGSLLAAFAILLMGPSPLLAPLIGAKSLGSMCAAFGLMGLAISPLWIPLFQLCIGAAKERGFNESSAGTCGFISGILQAATSLGAFLGATLGGAAVSLVGFPWTCTAVASLHLAWSTAQLIFLARKALWRRKRRRREEAEAKLMASSSSLDPPPAMMELGIGTSSPCY